MFCYLPGRKLMVKIRERELYARLRATDGCAETCLIEHSPLVWTVKCQLICSVCMQVTCKISWLCTHKHCRSDDTVSIEK